MEFEKKLRQILADKNKEAGKKQKIIFVEGGSDRAQIAAEEATEDHLLEPLLLFETRKQFEDTPPHETLKYLIIEDEKELQEQLVEEYYKARKGKEEKEDIRKAILKAPLFASVMLRIGMADGVIGGVWNSTADILRASFKGIGPQEGTKVISSVMLMHKRDDLYIFTDISVNPKPNKDALIEIANNASNFAHSLGLKSKIAFLSFSTDGSAVTEDTKMIAEACDEYNEKFQPKYPAIGEIQFDAAVDLTIRRTKYKKRGGFRKAPTILLFPDLSSGNIGYKITQRLGEWGAIGPVITGLKKPYNDLSRGSTPNDILNTAVITAIQSHDVKGDK